MAQEGYAAPSQVHDLVAAGLTGGLGPDELQPLVDLAGVIPGHRLEHAHPIMRLIDAQLAEARGDLDAAAEATDAAWQVAWPGLRRSRSTGSLGPWLCSLAAAEAVTAARSGRDPDVRGPTPDDPSAGSTGHDAAPAGRPAGIPADPGLAGALARLDPEDRALLALHHVAGLSTADLAPTTRRSRPPVPVRLERLTAKVGDPSPTGSEPPGSEPAEADRRLAERLCAYARVPVRQVDADAVARRARAEEVMERRRVVSVAISAFVGLLVAAAPYLAQLAFGR
jgi:DNA-directed RNA polymerase specialized sigma24 family protein